MPATAEAAAMQVNPDAEVKAVKAPMKIHLGRVSEVSPVHVATMELLGNPVSRALGGANQLPYQVFCRSALPTV